MTNHCRMCQRATGGAAAALKQVSCDAVTRTREPDPYGYLPIARRRYFAGRGIPATFGYLMIELAVGSCDDSACLRPVTHLGWRSRHPRRLCTKGLPHLRSVEYQPLVDG